VNTSAVPNPGSDAAIAIGCKCPVMDNGRGRGIWTANGVTFWISAECPVHCGNANPSRASDGDQG
jgi:hypothetical protein